MAQKLVKLFRGVKPADIPVEQPTIGPVYLQMASG